MRIQIVSDLHLETRERRTFETMIESGLTDTLALLGDIAPLAHPNLPKFLEWCSERWKTILYIPGKLECLSKETVEAAVARLRPSSPLELRALHRRDLEWVKAMTKKYTNKCLVLSHYGPVEWVQHERGPTDSAAAPIFTETELLLREPIVVWAFGHCHSYIEYTKVWNTAGGTSGTVLLVCNGMGPPRLITDRPAFEDFRKDAVLRIG